MLMSKNEISKLIDNRDYTKLRLYISFGYDLTLTDVNHDFVAKFGDADHSAFKAVISNDISALKKIKSHRLNIQNNSGYSLLQWAIITHNHDATRYLIESDVELDSMTESQDTAISLAARFNNLKAFLWLLKKNPQKNKKCLTFQNNKGFTALHFACANKNLKMMVTLLSIFSTNLTIKRNIYGATSLHWLVHGKMVSDKFKLNLLKKYYKIIYRYHSNKVIKDMRRAKNALGLTPDDWLDIYDHSHSLNFLARKN